MSRPSLPEYGAAPGPRGLDAGVVPSHHANRASGLAQRAGRLAHVGTGYAMEVGTGDAVEVPGLGRRVAAAAPTARSDAHSAAEPNPIPPA